MENNNQGYSANEKYIFLEAEIKRQMKLLESKLSTHSKRQKSNNRNFGYVGDLSYICQHIKELNDFLPSLPPNQQRKYN